MIEITIFPMRSLPDGSATIAERPIDPEFWDVLVQDDNGELLDEKEDLETYGAAEAAVGLFLLKYPDASVDYH
ncbi:MAG: hypothetical protein KDK08_25460 [Rhizobiaceae bacterium]|nr:hypothetical protein [Rhizobiaceae bacterium]